MASDKQHGIRCCAVSLRYGGGTRQGKNAACHSSGDRGYSQVLRTSFIDYDLEAPRGKSSYDYRW